jgi:hypothetical protein
MKSVTCTPFVGFEPQFYSMWPLSHTDVTGRKCVRCMSSRIILNTLLPSVKREKSCVFFYALLRMKITELVDIAVFGM